MSKLIYNAQFGRAIGPATKLDADGNPYPSFNRGPGGQPFPEGTFYYPDEYPAGINGAMQFVWEKGKWVWRWGDFHNSNANGDYTRNANGSQECWQDIGDFGTGTTIWTYPAQFVATPIVTAIGRRGDAATTQNWSIDNSGTSATQAAIVRRTNAQSTDARAIGRWKA